MVITPRRVDPGALPRWCRLALGLIVRGAGFWLALTSLFCVWMFVGQRFPLLDGTLALAAFFSSILIAAFVDRERVASTGEVLGALRAQSLPILRYAFLIACAGALIWMLLLSRPGVPWWNALYTERHTVEMLSENWYVALRQVFVYSAYALGLCYFGLNIPGLTSFFQFPLDVLLGAGWRDAYRLSAAGQIQNLAPMLGLGLLFIVLPVIVALLAPPLVPVLYCFFGALCYVAFREIFLGIADNARAPAPVAVAVPAGAGTRIRYHSPP